MNAIRNISHHYVQTFSEIKTIESNSFKTNIKVAVVVLSCFTVLIPLIFLSINKIDLLIQHKKEQKINRLKLIQAKKEEDEKAAKEKQFLDLKNLADAGNSQAQLKIATIYQQAALNCQGSTKQEIVNHNAWLRESIKYFEKAAEQGQEKAKKNLTELKEKYPQFFEQPLQENKKASLSLWNQIAKLPNTVVESSSKALFSYYRSSASPKEKNKFGYSALVGGYNFIKGSEIAKKKWQRGDKKEAAKTMIAATSIGILGLLGTAINWVKV